MALKSHGAVLPASAAVSEDRPSTFLVALMHRPDQREYRWASFPRDVGPREWREGRETRREQRPEIGTIQTLPLGSSQAEEKE